MSTANRPVALITGASRGIGEATARAFAQRGYALALVARSAEPLQRLAAELTRAGTPALALPADLTDLQQIPRIVQAVESHFGQIDVLVNNAGVGDGKALVDFSSAKIESVLTTNLIAPIELTKAVLPGMFQRKHGSIILLASVAGHIGVPTNAIYSASKFGLRGFGEALRRECRRHGVGVTIVSPGLIATAMTHEIAFPMPGPDHLAKLIADAARRPRREIITPGFYRIGLWLDHHLPWAIDRILTLRKD